MSEYDFTEYARELVKDWPPLTAKQAQIIKGAFSRAGDEWDV